MPRLYSQEDSASAAMAEDSENDTPPGRAWLYRIGFLLSLLCLGYFSRQVATLQAELDWFSAPILAHVGLAALLLTGAYFFAAGAWHSLLKLFGINVPSRLTLAIFLTTQFGKYLPGNVAQHIGRVTFAKRYGLAVKPVLASMVTETLLILSLMSAFSLPVLLVYFQLSQLQILVGLILCALLASAFATSDYLRSKLANLLATCRDVRATGFLAPLVFACASIFLSGSAMLSLHEAVLAQPAVWLHVFSVFCAAWVAGFLTPGAPAGLGIREVILSQGLLPIIGPDGATMAALLLRAATTLADILAFAVGLALLRKGKPSLA